MANFFSSIARSFAAPFVGPTRLARKGAEEAVNLIAPVPKLPEPVIPPPPTAEDPSVMQARERQAEIEAKRRGRRASILTSGRGIEADLGVVNRPEARAATLLG